MPIWPSFISSTIAISILYSLDMAIHKKYIHTSWMPLCNAAIGAVIVVCHTCIVNPTIKQQDGLGENNHPATHWSLGKLCIHFYRLGLENIITIIYHFLDFFCFILSRCILGHPGEARLTLQYSQLCREGVTFWSLIPHLKIEILFIHFI